MKTPRMRSDVTKEWVEYMINDYENRSNPGSKVTLTSWDIGDATKKGDGYSGDLVKLETKGMVECKGDRPYEKEYHHILKFQNPDAFAQEAAKRFKTGGNEMTVYSSVIPELNKFQSDHSDNQFPINIPTHIYSRNAEKEHVLVMENMKVLDYGNCPKEDFLGLEDAKIALEQLARLHGVSYAYNKKHDFLKKFPSYDLNKFSDFFVMCQDIFIDLIIEFLKTQPEHKEILEKVKASKPYTVKRMTDAFNKRNTQVFCLNHGDPWNNNILIKQNGDAEEGKVLFVDWEVAHWNTLSYDLNYFFGGSTTPDLRKNYQDELLHHYYSHLTNVTTTLGYPIHDWGFEQFEEEFLAVSAWGFGKNITFAGLLSEASKEWKITEQNVKPGKFKKGMAKIIFPLFMKPFLMNVMMKGFWKKFLNPVAKELKSNTNDLLNNRFIAIVLEADKNGLFDIPPIES